MRMVIMQFLGFMFCEDIISLRLDFPIKQMSLIYVSLEKDEERQKLMRNFLLHAETLRAQDKFSVYN